MTGATGAIGTALVKKLISSGIEVLVIIRKESERNRVIPQHPLLKRIYLDMSEYAAAGMDTKESCDVFFHLAWMGASGKGREDMFLQNDNIQYSLDAVTLAKKMGCRLFIGAGSQAEYGRRNQPLTSSAPVFPETGYGYAKLCAGQMTRDYAHQLGMEHIWMRILSIYGPNDWQGSLIAAVISGMRGSREIPLTAGEQFWDYLYSEDAAEALILTAQKGKDGKVYVLGSGKARPLKDYVLEISDFMGTGTPLAFGKIPYSSRQVMYLCADIQELHADTGWSPATGFLDGIKSMLGGSSK